MLYNLSYKKKVKSEMMMRNIPVLGVILMVFLACLPVPGLAESNSPGNKSLDQAKEMLKEMTSQSEEMLNQSQKEYADAKNASGMNSTAIDDFEATLSVVEQLINTMTDLIDSAVTIIDRITTFTKKIST